MAAYDNIQLDSDFTSQQYAPPLASNVTNVEGGAAGGAVTTLNGDSGGGAVGPIVTVSAGSTGYSFSAVGTSLTMTLGSADTVLASLGLSKNNVAVTPPCRVGRQHSGLFREFVMDRYACGALVHLSGRFDGFCRLDSDCALRSK